MAEGAIRAANVAKPRGFIAGLGVAQIVSWGTLYYSFPLIAEPMSASLGLTKVEVYGGASVGLASGGLAAYLVGRLIDRGHGRTVMTVGALFGALMLLAWSQIPSAAFLLPLFIGIGIAQATSLYEPAMAVVTRRFGPDARDGITQLTLWGGFASTVFIPITQALLEYLPWRDALFSLSLVQLGLAASLNAYVIRSERDYPAQEASTKVHVDSSTAAWASRQPVFWALLVAFTLYYAVFSALTLHLYPLMVERGLSVEAIVAILALIGPAQVLGRVVLWKGANAIPIRHIGVVTIAALMASLILLRSAGQSAIALMSFAVIYGCANGVMTIVRGAAVPEMLSRRAYGALNGLLATPAMMAKAIAPVAAAWIWSLRGSYVLTIDLMIAASTLVLASFVLAAWLSARTPQP